MATYRIHVPLLPLIALNKGGNLIGRWVRRLVIGWEVLAEISLTGFVFVKRICACEYDLCLWEICFFLKYKVFLHVQKIYLQAQIFITSTKLCYRDKTDFHAETHFFFLQAQNFVIETWQFFTQGHIVFTSTKYFHVYTNSFHKHKIFPRVHKFFSWAQDISTSTDVPAGNSFHKRQTFQTNIQT